MTIRAMAWYGGEHAGCVSDADWLEPRKSGMEDLSSAITAAGGTTRFLNQFNTEAKVCLWAAMLAMEAADGLDEPRAGGDGRGEIGIVALGYAGWLEAETRFFDDYVRHGRTNGRGSLFVYTLPTSVAAQVSLALRLDGPLLHFAAAGDDPISATLDQARLLVTCGEADRVLALYSDARACVCWVIDPGPAKAACPLREYWKSNLSPTELAQALANLTSTGVRSR